MKRCLLCLCETQRDGGSPASRKSTEAKRRPACRRLSHPGSQPPAWAPPRGTGQWAPGSRLRAAGMRPPLSQGLAALSGGFLATGLLTRTMLQTGLALCPQGPRKKQHPIQRPAFQNFLWVWPLAMGRELSWSHHQGRTCHGWWTCLAQWGLHLYACACGLGKGTPSLLPPGWARSCKLEFQGALRGPRGVGRGTRSQPTQWPRALLGSRPTSASLLSGRGQGGSPHSLMQPRASTSWVLRLSSEGTQGNLCVTHTWGLHRTDLQRSQSSCPAAG